jgi:ribonucleoside-diphosphate reductase alpha subunit
VREFLELKRNHGKEEVRARDLFYAMWIPDLFMRRVKADETWSLFCPRDAPDLQDAFGSRFDELYHEYEQKGVARATMKAVELYGLMLQAQLETGTPYMMFKDACNLKSNHQHLGTIRSSNLCTEIVQYSSPSEVAVCNLASIALPKCVSADCRSFDHDALASIVQRVTRALNRVIDRTFYPLEEARHSNLRHRPIGIGVQGLADVFMMLHLPFDSDDARALNKTIFETIYFAALDASCSLAAIHGTHASYDGSKASKGVLQHDMWGVPDGERLPWADLRKRIATHGLRNSLLVAPMPTASTAQIMNNTECIEPITSNVYARRVLAGEFPVINKHLVSDLGPLWTTTLCQQIIANRGSVQSLDVPQWIKDVHKTAWEIKQRRIIDLAADRGAYIDQSQSMNLFLAESTAAKLAAMHRHVWEMGLKGSYYLRTRPAVDAVKFTIDPKMLQPEEPSNATGVCNSCGA